MIFHMHKKEIPSFSLKLGNTNIEKIDDFNYLGLTVDTNLNWKNILKRSQIGAKKNWRLK